MDDAEDEELTTRQQHPVRLRVLGRRHHGAAIFVPGDDGVGVAFRLAVERGGVVARHVLILRVLDDHRVRERRALT